MTPRDPFKFAREPKKDGCLIVVGAYIKKSLSDSVSKAALLQGVSRSQFIENLLQMYFAENPINKQIIEILASRANGEWNSFALANAGKTDWDPVTNLKKYKTMLRKSLQRKGLEKEIINAIIAKVQ